MPKGAPSSPDAGPRQDLAAAIDHANRSGHGHAAAIQAVYAELARSVRQPRWTELAPRLAGAHASTAIPDSLRAHVRTTPAGFADLAAVHDAAARGASGRSHRRRLGQFFTPSALADQLARIALGNLSGAEPPRVLDPACGSGAFLLAAANAGRSSTGNGLSIAEASRLYGIDIDPVAAELCRLSLWFAAGADPSLIPALNQNIRVGNPLLGAPAEVTDPAAADNWSARFLDPRCRDPHETSARHGVVHPAIGFPGVFGHPPYGFDAVLGNPPFLNELRSLSARPRAVAELLRTKSAGILRGYADAATAFLWLAFSLVREGGVIAMIQPASLLANRDAAATRRLLAERATLVHLWLGRGDEFDAAVNTCAAVLRRGSPGSPPSRVTRSRGLPAVRVEPVLVDPNQLAAQQTWGPLVAAVLGIPGVRPDAAHTIGALASATADFRDEYYGLRGFVLDRSEGEPSDDETRYPRLINTGMIDLAVCRWGQRPVRLLGQRWRAPRLDADRMLAEGPLAAWVRRRLVPKILLATQTRTIELFVDASGTLLPTTPLITVVPRDPDRIWELAAQLASPRLAAHAAAQTLGAGRSLGAIRLRAAQVLDLPQTLTPDLVAGAAEALKRAHDACDDHDREAALTAFGSACCQGTDDAEDVLRWWNEARVKRPRSSGTPQPR